MSKKAVLLGVSTVRFQASNHAAAKAWYTEFLGSEPYFSRSGYCEFRLGDYQQELGLVDSGFMAQLGREREEANPAVPAPGGAVVYWHVDDLPATLDRLFSLGAKQHEPIKDFGGFIVTTVLDPFGNLLGIMYNPHYLEMLGAAHRS
jgi:predicted enzyme related to lactoylglutathione lyase